ncbi:hypothetical protein LUZ61_001112 [Rhynchospora tenuis]|uniref:NB-ARC domain-containing protein n=1 Tax=Rhynchospora tenuis TaxID=198213 RepID=A0AAD6EQG8_9POAL|nr:hypothetical protein LUZ61_001112 [Rhynchospora tenuis]
MDFLVKAIFAVLSSCVGIVSKNIAYPFKVSGNVKALESATSQLEAVQADVRTKINNAELHGVKQNNQVEEWSGKVKEVTGDVVVIKSRYEERCRCLGTQSFNCWSNYWISRDAAKKLVDVQNLLDRGGKFEDVATKLPPQVQEFSVGSEVGSKEEGALQEILRYIDRYDIIGIWGMGGVGKTRLLQLVHNHYKSNSAFDVVIFVTASRECSVEKLQAELCEKYGFGRGTNVESQAIIISNYLSNRNFLILLDDVWEQIDLQRVGIPSALGLVNQFQRKIVITTRLYGVCGLMDVQKHHKVVGLDFNNALRLFYQKVGYETINSNPLIKSLAAEVVHELDGLPLALITIGRSMHAKKDPGEWKDVIDLLQKSRMNEIEITREEETIYYKLKYSYDSLENNELRDCFLACSLWPEDHSIQKTELIESWIGLGLLNVYDARNIYNPGYTIIGKLLSASLLEESIVDSVKMHDVIRDMALWLAHDFGKTRDKWIVREGVGVGEVLHKKDGWPQVERVTLFTNRSQILVTQSIPSDANKLQFLNIRKYGKYYSVETLVNNLGSFCNLTFLNLSYCKLTSFPQGICKLVNLRHLNLSRNEISSVPEELKLVKNLRILLLSNNTIDSFPKGVISELKELLIIDLFENKINREHMLWLIKEFGSLGNIRSLGITLPDAILFWYLLKFTNLPIRYLELDYSVNINETDTLLMPSSFIGNSRVQNNLYQLVLRVMSVSKIEIKSDSENSCCGLNYLENLKIDGMQLLEEIIWQNIAPKDLFLRLCVLSISYCWKLKDVSWTLHLPCLRYFWLKSCENIIQLDEHFDLANGGTKERRAQNLSPTFPSLAYLSLDNLPELQIICDQSIMFPNLRYIHIKSCSKIKKLPFRSNTIPRNLKSISLSMEFWDNLEWEDDNLKQVLGRYIEPLH